MSGVLLRLKTEWNGVRASLSILQKVVDHWRRTSSLGNSFWISLTVFGLFCYCHFVIKSRATCRPKSRCQSDLSKVSDLANRSLHQDLMHSGCRGMAVPIVCLQAFSLFPPPSSPLDQRPVHRLFFKMTSRQENRSELFVYSQNHN